MTDQNEQNQKSECCGGKCGDHHDHEHQCGCGAKPAAAEGGCGCSDKPAEAAKKETAEPTPQELKAQLKAAEQKVIEHYDLYVRAMADLENARRRSSEELVKTRKFAIEKFAENLLPVVDSLEKALEATAADKDSAAREGMEATYRQLMHALDVSDMKPIDPKGEAFDPHFHMAITMVPAPEGVKPGMVVQVFQRGWNIAGRVSDKSRRIEGSSGIFFAAQQQTSFFTDVPLKKNGVSPYRD